MATSEITPVVEKRKESASSLKSPNQQETGMENSRTSTSDHVQKSRAKLPTTMKELVDPKGPFILKWNVIFIVSCVCAVLLDPLFLYIPIITNEKDIKCLRSDNNLKIGALVLRSVTDLFYLLNIFFRLYRIFISTTNSSSALRWGISCSPMAAKTMWHSSILIDILSVLPIPQIIILKFYFNMRGSRSFGTRKQLIMNFFIIVQYVPRVFRIYKSCKEYSKNKSSRKEIPIWLKGVLNFFLYVLASHVIGAFWYFYAVQQITTCWQYACRSDKGCVPNNLYCHDHHAFMGNIKFLDDLCSVDPQNENLFNFGIFLDIFQLGILGSTNYVEKFSNCFGWALRNLSSFGSNLKPSTNAWENLFAAFISLIGLLLFLYLIGNLQAYIQLDTVSSLDRHIRKMKIEKKMEEKSREVELWLSKNGIPSSKKLEIMEKVEVELKRNKDVDVENILSILPLDLQDNMESCMPLNRLKQVLENMDEGVLRAISKYLKPEKYTKDEIVVHEKELLQKMIFIVEGHVIIEMRDCSSTLKRSAGEVYGEKLLSWPAWTSFPSVLPVATESVKADGDVEALVLMANDMKDVGQKFRLHFSNKMNTGDEYWALLESDRVTMLRKVPKLKTMDTRVLKAISENLKPIVCNPYIDIIREGKPLRMMVIVPRGSLSLKKDGAWTNDKCQFYGEELLDWVLDRSFPAIVPISTSGVCVRNKTDVLILTAKDLGGVVSNFKSHFSKEITSPTDISSLDLCAIVGLTWLKKGPSIFRRMDEEVLSVISKHFKLISYNVDDYIIRENEPLKFMFIFIDESSMSIESTRQHFERRGIGEFYGEELVHWITYWAAHATFPNKLPLSTHDVKVCTDDTGYARVFVLSADDLKGIVSKFWSQFNIKQTTLPVNNEGNLSTTFDPLATLKKVPRLKYVDEIILEKICTRLIATRYNDVSPYIIEEELDKMFLIASGLVSIRSIKGGEKVYHYSGNYYGEELFEWALHPSRAYNHSLPKSDVCVAVGDVEVLLLKANDLIRLVLEINFLNDGMNLFVQKQETYMRLDAKTGKEDETRKASIEKKIGREVEWWLTKNGIPSSKQSNIMQKVLGKLEENKDVDVENILSILPLDLQSSMKSYMPLNRLKQVPLLQNFDENVLRAISEYLVPKKYTNVTIIEEKKPLQMMIFIVEGCIIIEGGDFPSPLERSAGEVYGEKLLSWPEGTSFPDYLPVATESVTADGDVEALVLMARDMEDVGWKFRTYFSSKKITRLINDELKLLESEQVQVTMLRKVPKLETMDTEVLQAISKNLKPMSCKTYINIIREGKPLRKMVFVTGGSISLKKDGAWTNEKRQFYGEELLDWVLDRSFPAIVPISTHGVWVHNTDILVLTANDLGGVVSNFKSHFSKEITSPTDDSSLDLCAIVGLTWLKKVPSIFQRIDEEVLKVISKHLKLISYKVDTYIVSENEPLEYTFIFVDGCSMSIESTRRPIERGLHNIGKFYGEELVHWVTNWASHATFPDKLPLSTSDVKLSIDDTGNARVLVLWADDLKRIVSKFRSQFIKQTTLPLDSEWQLSTFDPLATLKKVPLLADMDQKQLEKIRDSFIPKRYNDMSPYIIEGDFDKMFLIESGLVSVTSIASFEKVYRYSGNYCGDELLKRAFHPSWASKSIVLVEAVGEVEALVIEADDLIRLVSQFNRVYDLNPHF